MTSKDITAKDIIKIALNLVVIYLIGGFLLALVYAKTSPIIYKKSLQEKAAALKKMVPEAKSEPRKLGDWSPYHHHAEYYKVQDGDSLIGYIVETYGKGYSSYINILVALSPEMVITKMDVLSHAETPGLGDEIEKDWFKDMFKGKDLDHLVVIKGDTEDKIQAITGATISTRAVTNGIRDGITMLMNAGEDQQEHSGHGQGAGGAE